MALSNRYSLIKRLQTSLPHGSVFGSQALAELGISSALAHQYCKSGWVKRLGRGTFMFPNDNLRLEDCLLFLARRVAGFHVGGKSALAWRGLRHNISPREPLSLWGSTQAMLPTWFRQRFGARYTARNPFTNRLPANFGLQPLPETPNGVLVSVPERALLEMLSEVGLHQGVEEARNIMELARALRPEVLATLLKHCHRIKVLRLCVQWSEELNLPWKTVARQAAADHCGHGRWTARLRDGTLLVLKP